MCGFTVGVLARPMARSAIRLRRCRLWRQLRRCFICACSASRSCTVSTSNSSHSLAASTQRTRCAWALATKPPPLPGGNARSSSKAQAGNSTGAPCVPWKPTRQMNSGCASALRSRAARVFALMSGWSAWMNVTVSHPPMACIPRRTVSLLSGSSCTMASTPRVRHSFATSLWRVTATRFANNPSHGADRVGDERRAVKVRHKLVRPEARAQARCHDDAAMHGVRGFNGVGHGRFAFADSMVGRLGSVCGAFEGFPGHSIICTFL